MYSVSNPKDKVIHTAVLIIAALVFAPGVARASTLAQASYGTTTCTPTTQSESDPVTVNLAASCGSYPNTFNMVSAAASITNSSLVPGLSAATTAIANQLVNDRADASAMFDFQFVVIGGSGTGTVEYQYNFTGSYFEDEGSFASDGFDLYQNGVDILSYGCGSGIAMVSCGDSLTSKPVTFTYGVPFTLSGSITSDSGSGFDVAKAILSAQYSGLVLSGGTLEMTPEPGTGAVALLLGLLAGRCWCSSRVLSPRRKDAKKPHTD